MICNCTLPYFNARACESCPNAMMDPAWRHMKTEAHWGLHPSRDAYVLRVVIPANKERKPMDKTRYEWIEQDNRDQWLVDKNQHRKVLAIVSNAHVEEGVVWWGVYAPFKKRAISQHPTQKEALAYAEDHLAIEQAEERVSWES